MDKIYLKGNYIIVETGGLTFTFGKSYCIYTETTDSFNIRSFSTDNRQISIPFSDVGNYYDESGSVQWTFSDLQLFFRENTGFKSPSGGSGGGVTDGDKGDIVVSNSGATWRVDNGVITDVKIVDVSASKVNEDSTHRFVTDAQLANLANQSGVNTGDETTGTIQTKLGVASTSTDGYLTQTDWNTFHNKQDALGFTPVPDTNTITINGDVQTLGSNPSFSVSGADPSGWTTIVKTANQDAIDTTAWEEDAELQFSVVAGGLYMIEMFVFYSGNTTAGDYRFGFRVDNGTINIKGKQDGFSNSGAVSYILLSGSNVSQVDFVMGTDANINSVNPLIIRASVTATNNEILKYIFRLNSGSTGRIARTWKGSILKYKRID